MNKDDALKLALAALDELKYSSSSHAADDIYYEALTSIREALAEPPCKTGSQCTSKCPQCEQPAQQQEPVSVMTVLHLKDRTEIGYGPASAGYDLPTGEYKLYKSPPASKPWVGLTDVNEMVEAQLTHYWNGEYADTTGARDHLSDFARAIEAKLREKNA